jgi:hypothetical protein
VGGDPLQLASGADFDFSLGFSIVEGKSGGRRGKVKTEFTE